MISSSFSMLLSAVGRQCQIESHYGRLLQLSLADENYGVNSFYHHSNNGYFNFYLVHDTEGEMHVLLDACPAGLANCWCMIRRECPAGLANCWCTIRRERCVSCWASQLLVHDTEGEMHVLLG
jgi:hypothetical protein